MTLNITLSVVLCDSNSTSTIHDGYFVSSTLFSVTLYTVGGSDSNIIENNL